MTDNWWVGAYVIVVVAAGLVTVVRVNIGLYRTRAVRLRRLFAKRQFEAIPTETPVDNPTAVARRRASESIDQQFTVTRRIVVPLVFFVTVVLIGLPFLDRAPATLVSVLIAIVTLLGGVAARPFLENAIAGLVISGSKLINLGDTVAMGDLYGTVEDITATHTTIKLWDWRRYVVPNSQMLHSSFVNYSLHDQHIWAAVDVWVSYEADVERVRTLAVEAARSSANFAGHEDPEFWVLDLTRDGVHCILAAWAELPSKAWLLKHDVRLALALAFRDEGIRAAVQHVGVSIPEPRPDLASISMASFGRSPSGEFGDPVGHRESVAPGP